MRKLLHRHRGKIGVLSVLAMLVPAYIELDRWVLERRQMKARMDLELAVAECEAGNGHWWRGDCHVVDDDHR